MIDWKEVLDRIAVMSFANIHDYHRIDYLLNLEYWEIHKEVFGGSND